MPTLPTPEQTTQPEKAVGGNPTAAEEGLRDAEEESKHASRYHLPPVASHPKVLPPTKGKEKMPPIDRQTPDLLKQLRLKQTTKAKLMAAQNRQRADAMKEKEK